MEQESHIKSRASNWILHNVERKLFDLSADDNPECVGPQRTHLLEIEKEGLLEGIEWDLGPCLPGPHVDNLP